MTFFIKFVQSKLVIQFSIWIFPINYLGIILGTVYVNHICSRSYFFELFQFSSSITIMETRLGQFSWSVYFYFTYLTIIYQILFIIDALIGLPAVFSAGIDLQVETERLKFLVVELSPTVKLYLLIYLKIVHNYFVIFSLGNWKRNAWIILYTNTSIIRYDDWIQ